TGGPGGLVGYWPFDEGAGVSVGDFSGNGSGGTIEGDPVWTAGKIGSAIQFAPNSVDQVNIGNPAALNLTGAVTVSAWIKPLGTSNYGVIAGIDKSGGPTDDQFVLKTTQSGNHQLTFQVTNNGSQVNATDTMNLNTRAAASEDGWLHVAGVFVPGV